MKRWLSKGANFLIVCWVTLSLILIFCIAFFRIDGYISSPQHGYVDNFKEINNIIKSNATSYPLFWLYFILDFLWAAALLLIIRYVLRKGRKNIIFKLKNKAFTVLSLYTIIACLAFLFDILEGIWYLGNFDYLIKYIINIKLGLYAICFIFLLYALLKQYVIPNVKSILRFTITSLVSIIFIIIVYALVTVMPQGGTLVVELFYSPWDIVLFFFSLAFLAIMLSHFPAYVDIWLYGSSSCVELKMPKISYKLLGFGIIYYNTINAGSEAVKNFDNKIVKSLRRSLGILLYVAVFNIFLGTGARFFEFHFNSFALTLFVLIVTVVVYYQYGETYNYWKRTLAHPFAPQLEKKKVVNAIVKYVSGFPRYFLFSTLLVVGTAVVTIWTQWSRLSFVLICITTGCQMFLYVYFKITRTYFKYVFYSKKIHASQPQMYNVETLRLFKTLRETPNRGANSIYCLLGHLSNNVSYLALMRLSGIISFIIIVLANISPWVAAQINPINIIILYIILFYSAVIILFKHILFYHRTPLQQQHKNLWELFRYGIPVLILFLMGWAIYSSSQENDLHELSMVPDQGAMPYEQYVDTMLYDEDGVKKKNMFFVGSYGGGLKANLWNLILFHELERMSGGQFMENTLVLSGVSGGAVGIGNYASLAGNFHAPEYIDQQITTIGESNVLSGELTYLLGWDWIREYFHLVSYHGTDRSYVSMRQHAHNTGMVEYNTTSYHNYWKKIYEKQDKRFPALIMNSTSVSGKQGVASTVDFPEKSFPAADLLSQFSARPDSSITYFGAVSTTNRFPLFSPTAKIVDKGNYLDGGYFENSGMLSALGVYDALAEYDDSHYKDKINPIFINIINSKDYYIGEKLRQWKFETHSIADAGEFSSILGTVANIDKLPRYVAEKIKSRNFSLENIMMPHKITYDDARAILKAEVNDPLRLMDSIKKHNVQLDEALQFYEPYHYERWGVVQPPLARVLGKPAVQYQRAMVECHDSVRNAINRIIDYIDTDRKVDRSLQQNMMQYQKSHSGESPTYMLKKTVKTDSLKK